jgi:hypothetical protein
MHNNLPKKKEDFDFAVRNLKFVMQPESHDAGP